MNLTDLPPVEGVTHRDVVVRGVRLHVAEAGDGPPLVLLHGWPQHWWEWRKVIPVFARTHRVLAPDLRGWGWSDAPPGDYAKATFAADVLALLDAEGLDRVQVVGHDWGGWTAFLLALEHPERVERLLTIDIPPPWPQRAIVHPRMLGLPLFASYQVLVGTPGVGPATMTSSNRFVRGVLRAGSARRGTWTEAELDAYAAVLRDPARARASSACYRTFLTRELPALMRTSLDRGNDLQVPTLLLMGEKSPVSRLIGPKGGHNLRLETIPGAGHFVPEEAPDDVLRHAAGWLGTEAP